MQYVYAGTIEDERHSNGHVACWLDSEGLVVGGVATFPIAGGWGMQLYQSTDITHTEWLDWRDNHIKRLIRTYQTQLIADGVLTVEQAKENDHQLFEILTSLEGVAAG